MYVLHQLFIGIFSALCVAAPFLVGGVVYLIVRAIDEFHTWIDEQEGVDNE